MSMLSKSLLAASCALGLAGPAAAIHVNESFDGAWVDPSAAGNQKGLMVDYIPSANTFFFAFFTYDAAGEQLWTVGSFQPEDGLREYTVPVSVVTGGRFSEEGTPSEAPIGTALVRLGCDAIDLDFTPGEGVPLTAASYRFQPSLGLDRLTAGECSSPADQCPAGTTPEGERCALPSSIPGNLVLTAGKDYVVNGRVTVEAGGKLSIAPGVTVIGGGSATAPNFIVVKAGGQIYANGTREQPITFTGPEPVPGSWAGLVIAGRSICNDATPTQPCQFEAVPDITYGSATDPVLEDSSGVLRYVRILWAGQQIAPDEELNGLTLLAVGSGTVLEHVQVDGGLDDGFEMFGGTVNGRYLVCSNMGDDCFDFDQGYRGKLQFGLGWQGSNPDQTSDSNGFETDNDSNNNDKQPRTEPMVANFTMVGRPSGTRDGMRIRRGAGGHYVNMVVTGYTRRCLNLDDAGTFALGTGTQQGERLTMTHSFMGSCTGGTFDDAAGDPYPVSAWYAAGAGNQSGDPVLDGFLPAAGSPVLEGGGVLADGFFQPTTYRGAFGPGENWTKDWTVNLPGQ